jgi:hypothetical protein
MADFFGDNQPGTWAFSSASDPRWNGSGRVDDLVITAGPPQEAKDFLEAKKKELGEFPKDLRISMYKD